MNCFAKAHHIPIHLAVTLGFALSKSCYSHICQLHCISSLKIASTIATSVIVRNPSVTIRCICKRQKWYNGTLHYYRINHQSINIM